MREIVEGNGGDLLFSFALTPNPVSIAKDWVIEQTLARIRRDIEADEREYEARLAKARKREDMLRRAAKARVVKRQVGKPVHFCSLSFLKWF